MLDINSKLTKPITETKYLTAENCWRYRPILRYFYQQYEKIKYWMYKEEVFEELKSHLYFESYTIEQCSQDFDALVEWGNLIPVQDTSRASTVEEFKNKQFRYQLSEYTIEIERLTIKLENIFVEGASLEPSLFERIKDEVQKINSLVSQDAKTAGTWWRNLNNDFKRLNQNYQDYIRSFHSLKAEEWMRTKEFIVYKDALIDYLREFVKGLQKNAHIIEETLRNVPEVNINIVLSKVLEYEKSIPRLDVEVSEKDISDNLNGRWENFAGWFLGDSNRESEVVKILDITNEIIRKITRYASQIAESRNNAANRKEEYKKLCGMFLACKNMDEAHKLSAMVFGIFGTKHIKGDIIRKTESINSGVYDEEPLNIEIKPRVRSYREKGARSAIEDKGEKKMRMLRQYIIAVEQEKGIVESYIRDNVLELSSLPAIKPHVRAVLLKWIGKACTSPGRRAKTEDGRAFTLLLPEGNKRCCLRCEDGDLEMPAFVLRFE